MPSPAFANLVWPALHAEAKVSSIYIILLSLLIEYAVIRWLFKQNIKKSILYALSANLASGLFGLILRPLSGVIWELSLGKLVMIIFDWGTFNPVAWFCVPIIGGLINAVIEIQVIKRVWKQETVKKDLYILLLVNWITVGLATIWVVISPPTM